MVQREGELKRLRDEAFLAAIKETSTPEQAATRLGVSLSTVMRFKRQLKLAAISKKRPKRAG